ncbi:MAG: TonB-dependent receptor plug domain-containing protein, partial [Myxococcales bacterium]|nr:TonB-dependent receptor plug domain-containing protein [Myxococcales bacterium]
GRPIRAAEVALEGATDHVTTDTAGRFTLEAPLGANLVVTSQRHGAALALVSGHELDDIVLLLDLATEKIEIGDLAPTAAQGAAQLDREDLQRMPGTGGDVVRALTAMPGVVNTQLPVGYSGVVIRGSSPQDSKVLIDDFEVPLLFHPLGIRAVVPAESIQALNFIPGGFDVSYGRSSSGIVQLTTRPGSETRTTQAEVSLIDGGLVAQGSIGQRTRYMVALRRSVIDFVLPLAIPDSVDLSLTTVPQYWDEQVRIDHTLSSTWDLTFSSLGTDDVFELFTTKDEDAGAKRFYSRTRFLRLTGAAKYRSGEWQASLALSGMLTDLRAEIGLYQRLGVTTPLITPRATATRTMAKALGLKDVVWSSGAEAQIGYSTIDIAIPLERREGEPFPAYDPEDTTTNFQGSVWFPDFAAWTSVAASFDPRVRVTLGLRADAFARPGEIAVQPRSEIQVRLTDTLSTRFAAGRYRRPPEFQSEFLDKNVKSERSDQMIMGLEYTPILGVRVQGSLYYTDRSKLITHEADGSLVNRGRGTSKGGEILAVIHGGTWFGWLGYSYSNSQRVDVPGGPSRLFDYDQPHSLNLAASWKRGHWQLGGRFQLYSGLPSTPVIGAEFDSDRNLHIPIPGEVNSDRAPIHHQLDVRVDYAWTWGPAKLLAYLDVQNVYLDRSVVTYFYSYDYTQRSAFESLPLLPSAGLRVVL